MLLRGRFVRIIFFFLSTVILYDHLPFSVVLLPRQLGTFVKIHVVVFLPSQRWVRPLYFLGELSCEAEFWRENRQRSKRPQATTPTQDFRANDAESIALGFGLRLLPRFHVKLGDQVMSSGEGGIERALCRSLWYW